MLNVMKKLRPKERLPALIEVAANFVPPPDMEMTLEERVPEAYLFLLALLPLHLQSRTYLSTESPNSLPSIGKFTTIA